MKTESNPFPMLCLVLLSIVIWAAILIQTTRIAWLYWGGFFTIMLVLILVNAVSATRIALAGLFVGGAAVWFLRESSFSPAVVNLLPWGASVSGVFLYVASTHFVRAHRKAMDRRTADAVSQLEPGSDALVSALIHPSEDVRERAKERLYSLEPDLLAVADIICAAARKNQERRGEPGIYSAVTDWMPSLIKPLVDRGEDARAALLHLYGELSHWYIDSLWLVQDAIFTKLAWPDDKLLWEVAEHRIALGQNQARMFQYLWEHDRDALPDFAERAFLAGALHHDQLLQLEPEIAAEILAQSATQASNSFFKEYWEIFKAVVELPPELGFPILIQTLEWDLNLGYGVEAPFRRVLERVRSSPMFANLAERAPAESSSLLNALEHHLARTKDERAGRRPRPEDKILPELSEHLRSVLDV